MQRITQENSPRRPVLTGYADQIGGAPPKSLRGPKLPRLSGPPLCDAAAIVKAGDERLFDPHARPPHPN
jgi:hypothetical protein